MLVHPVVIPGSGTRSWTVLGDDDVPVVAVDRRVAEMNKRVAANLNKIIVSLEDGGEEKKAAAGAF